MGARARGLFTIIRAVAKFSHKEAGIHRNRASARTGTSLVRWIKGRLAKGSGLISWGKCGWIGAEVDMGDRLAV